MARTDKIMVKQARKRQSALDRAKAEAKAEEQEAVELVRRAPEVVDGSVRRAAKKPCRKTSFIDEIVRLAKSGEKLPQSLLEEGERRSFDTTKTYYLILNSMKAGGFHEDGLRSIKSDVEWLIRQDDAAAEKEFGLSPDDVGLWKQAHPEQTARPGEVWRWAYERDEREEREASSLGEDLVNLRARQIAAGERDKTPPKPTANDLRAVFEMLRKKDWKDHERWPTAADLKDLTGLPRKQLLPIATAGRWGKKNIYRGSPCRRKCGGRPQHRIGPAGVARIVLKLAENFPVLSISAKKLVEFLSSQKK